MGTACWVVSRNIQLIDQVYSKKSPLERRVLWFREVLGERHGPGCLSVSEWITLIAFGKLRQHSSVTLLLPSHSNYLGFHPLTEPGQMGRFIAAQDSIVWAQRLMQEVSKLAGTNSTKASVCLANLWCHFSDPTLFMKLQRAKDYYGMVNVLQEMPGHGPFIAKDIVKTALNPVHLSGVATADLGPNLRAVMRGYLAGKLFFGTGFENKDFEDVRSCVNNLCQGVTVCYRQPSFVSAGLTGPRCKLKGNHWRLLHTNFGTSSSEIMKDLVPTWSPWRRGTARRSNYYIAFAFWLQWMKRVIFPIYGLGGYLGKMAFMTLKIACLLDLGFPLKMWFRRELRLFGCPSICPIGSFLLLLCSVSG